MDERDRQPIGRPYLTVAIEFTRCLLGMAVTLDAPSAVSVGLCLAHVACDKRPRLEVLSVEMDWPMSGKPMLLYLDNAAEFKSEALHRGCEQHGIRRSRPMIWPHRRPTTARPCTKLKNNRAPRGLVSCYSILCNTCLIVELTNRYFAEFRELSELLN